MSLFLKSMMRSYAKRHAGAVAARPVSGWWIFEIAQADGIGTIAPTTPALTLEVTPALRL
jgi:hypothetical protein